MKQWKETKGAFKALEIIDISTQYNRFLQVRMRDTFMKVAQSMMVKKQLVAEKGLKEKMIHSVMPPKVAEWLMRGHVEDLDEGTSVFPASTVQSTAGEDLDAKAKRLRANQMDDDCSSQAGGEDYQTDCSSVDDMDFAGK